MKTLIIYAHPGNKGHSPYTLEQVQKQLKKRKESYEIIDLYKMKYDPVLKSDEHYTGGGFKLSAQTKAFQKKIKNADNLIFIYPVWWGSMPAILKGFIDRVFTGRFAFTYKPLGFNFFGLEARPVGLLKGRAAIFVSTGAVAWISRLSQPTARSYLKKLLRFVGIQSRVFMVDKANMLNKKNKSKIRKNVTNGLDWLL